MCLCEKPMGLTAFEADAMIHAARKAGTFLGEAFMYRLHPQTAKLVELVKSGAIGEVRMIKSSFGFAMPGFMPEHRLYANDLAGGGILDVGGYPVSMARLIAGAAAGKPFAEPDKVAGAAHLGQSGVDEWASALLHFPGGIVAEVSCSISLNQDNVLRILGTKGRIEVADFWFAGGKRGRHRQDRHHPAATAARDDRGRRRTRWLYSFEVDAAGEAILAGRQEFAWPGMGWADSLGNLRVLDKWRAAAGLEYEIEKAGEARQHDLRPAAARRRHAPSPSARSRACAKPASVVALGFEDFRTFSSGSILLDAFFEAGGNLFDTGFVYGAGRTETLLGEWLTNRGVRDAVGDHRQGRALAALLSRRDRQAADAVARPAADRPCRRLFHAPRQSRTCRSASSSTPWTREVKAGRIRGPFGGSNWTSERMDEAIAYAERTGKQKPGALSNNFSLAEMLEPIWPGCVTSSTDEWKAWLTARQMPNFAWSSQGRGFFTDRAGRDKRDNEELVRVWYSEKNFGRRDRAIELAQQARQEPDPCRARLCAGPAVPVGPADRPAHARRARRQPARRSTSRCRRTISPGWTTGTDRERPSRRSQG